MQRSVPSGELCDFHSLMSASLGAQDLFYFNKHFFFFFPARLPVVSSGTLSKNIQGIYYVCFYLVHVSGAFSRQSP